MSGCLDSQSSRTVVVSVIYEPFSYVVDHRSSMILPLFRTTMGSLVLGTAAVLGAADVAGVYWPPVELASETAAVESEGACDFSLSPMPSAWVALLRSPSRSLRDCLALLRKFMMDR